MTRKKWWLLPIVIFLILLGALIVFTEGSALAPFIYTLFWRYVDLIVNFITLNIYARWLGKEKSAPTKRAEEADIESPCRKLITILIGDIERSKKFGLRAKW